ncbi:ATP-binding protein [candidate division FCPU426 bacterium]|nr:ATP-binding protein [candidate division FCPU426 bacterium]
MQIKRYLDLNSILMKKSCFLWGPRQTGKSWLIAHQIKADRVYDLLDGETFLQFTRNPSRLEAELRPSDRVVVIDEIQKVPGVLDQVHRLIEKRSVRFLLTGSSARKLRRGGVNLLGGRARARILHPFSQVELGKHFHLDRALAYGLLPAVFFSDSPREDLKAYAGDYLAQEIAAEGLVRNIPAFSRFLEVAALCNSQMANYSKIASDAQVPRRTVQEYFQILKDTLLAFEISGWGASVKRKPIRAPKYYFFDVGLANYFQHRQMVSPGSPEYGAAFETYLAHELKTYCDYLQIDSLHYWRSQSGFEVDFVLGDEVAIEVKAKKHVSERDLKGLQALKEEKRLKKYLLVCMEARAWKHGNISVVPWREFLSDLWEGKVIDWGRSEG